MVVQQAPPEIILNRHRRLSTEVMGDNPQLTMIAVLMSPSAPAQGVTLSLQSLKDIRPQTLEVTISHHNAPLLLHQLQVRGS